MARLTVIADDLTGALDTGVQFANRCVSVRVAAVNVAAVPEEIFHADVAVIAVAENMEASITATMQVKELGVPFVMAKAMNSLHGRILEKIGADKVIYPEHSMGVRVARNLLSSGFIDMFELSSDFSMAEFKIPQEWIGKTLRDLKIREKYHINLIGLKQGERINMNVQPDKVLPADCTIVAAGANSDLNKVSGN